MSIDNLKKEMSELVSEVKSHNDLLTSIGDVLSKAMEKVATEKVGLDADIQSKMQEIALIEGNIDEKIAGITRFDAEIAEIAPKFDNQENMIADFSKMVTELEAKAKKLKEDISTFTDKDRNLDNEISEKTDAKNSLLSSIDKKVAENENQLKEVKEVYNSLSDKYVAMEFLFNKIETPEVEIMAIIVANSPISTDDIKSQAKSVLPIFVGRAITKLEADGKIVSDGEKWNLSPRMTEKL